MGFTVDILRGIKRKGYQLPTPIQRRAMPAIMAGADVVGMARTGSGKTAAFVLPMLQRLGAHAQRAGARAVILAPTRELALQTSRVVSADGDSAVPPHCQQITHRDIEQVLAALACTLAPMA